MPTTELTAQVEILQKAFVASLPAKISRIDALLQQCASAFSAGQALPAKTLREAHLLVHSLAGSGGTFGCHALSEAAGALEALITPLLSAELAIKEHTFEQIALGLAAIKATSAEPIAQPIGLSPARQAKPKRYVASN